MVQHWKKKREVKKGPDQDGAKLPGGKKKRNAGRRDQLSKKKPPSHVWLFQFSCKKPAGKKTLKPNPSVWRKAGVPSQPTKKGNAAEIIFGPMTARVVQILRERKKKGRATPS